MAKTSSDKGMYTSFWYWYYFGYIGIPLRVISQRICKREHLICDTDDGVALVGKSGDTNGQVLGSAWWPMQPTMLEARRPPGVEGL